MAGWACGSPVVGSCQNKSFRICFEELLWHILNNQQRIYISIHSIPTIINCCGTVCFLIIKSINSLRRALYHRINCFVPIVFLYVLYHFVLSFVLFLLLVYVCFEGSTLVQVMPFGATPSFDK